MIPFYSEDADNEDFCEQAVGKYVMTEAGIFGPILHQSYDLTEGQEGWYLHYLNASGMQSLAVADVIGFGQELTSKSHGYLAGSQRDRILKLDVHTPEILRQIARTLPAPNAALSWMAGFRLGATPYFVGGFYEHAGQRKSSQKIYKLLAGSVEVVTNASEGKPEILSTAQTIESTGYVFGGMLTHNLTDVQANTSMVDTITRISNLDVVTKSGIRLGFTSAAAASFTLPNHLTTRNVYLAGGVRTLGGVHDRVERFNPNQSTTATAAARLSRKQWGSIGASLPSAAYLIGGSGSDFNQAWSGARSVEKLINDTANATVVNATLLATQTVRPGVVVLDGTIYTTAGHETLGTVSLQKMASDESGFTAVSHSLSASANGTIYRDLTGVSIPASL